MPLLADIKSAVRLTTAARMEVTSRVAAARAAGNGSVPRALQKELDNALKAESEAHSLAAKFVTAQEKKRAVEP